MYSHLICTYVYKDLQQWEKTQEQSEDIVAWF